MKKLILKALLTFTVLSMTLSPVFALDEVAPTNGNEITQKQIANISENDSINYVYLEETETTNSYENVVLSLKDEYKNASNAILTYTDSSNKSYQVNSSNQNDSEVLFKIENLTEGTYQLSSMTFEMDGNVYQSTFTSDYNASFSVVNGVSTQSLDNCDEEVEEYANDSSMKVVEATSLDEALDAVKSVKARSHNGNYVVYLDAGHDNTHTGARGVNGIKEETYTLAIAQACRDELQQYRNVEVHMCRDDSGSCPYPGTSSVQCNTNRVRDAASKGADLYIALHLNSANGSAHGAEVYVSNNSAYYSQGANLANKIVAQLKALGLSAHGSAVKVNAGANGVDKYTVIKHGVEHGINSMIVEHAFVDNYSDANYITNRYHDIGVADATAIANYLGLSKGPHVTLKGFTWQVHDDRILIGTAYEANTNVRFTFKSYNLSTHQWVTLGENKTSNWQTWLPEKGNYWIYVEATTPDGYTTNQVMCFAVGKNYAPYVSLNGFTWQVFSDRINIGTAYSTNTTGVRFTFKSYNLDTKKWTALSNEKASNWQTWYPEKGNYWIYVEATLPNGYKTNQVMCFAVGKNYSTRAMSARNASPAGTTLSADDGIAAQAAESYYARLKGFTWQMQDDKILLGSAYDTNDPDLRFTFKSYNLDTKKWEVLDSNKKSNWQTWKPYKGNYWVYCQATTSDGKSYDQTMCFAVGKNYASYVNLNGFTWQIHNDKILIGSAYDTNDSGTQFSFKAYNLDTQKWETLSTFKSSNWQTWKPYKGNYWIYCQAKTSTGYTTDQVMCFAVGKDYGPYVHLNGYTWQMKSDSILVGSAYNTNDSDVKFTYKSYNLTTKQWQSLSDNSSSNWVTWKPERGNYWIYCQAKTSNGYTSDQTMCFAVSEDYSGNLYRIMGSSSITVDQMVKFYENGKGNATYDTFGESQYNGCLTQGGAPDIRTYCQIFKEEAENEGVKVEVAFTQAMLETGYLKFGGDVKPNQYNFAGIGATGNGNPGNSFGDVRTGIRAQIQHLKCYASTDSLNLAKVDPRWNNNLRGKAKYVEYLSIPNNPYGTGWAASATYGKDLLKLITNLYKC
ncbi:N-acetylmuramoyl-L-alanine amidase [Faecalibacillus faecis]|uniref:N-acetylmuramoyl-L-alanine amidase n=1 Tax=Faecalibacillus faecis TaxID=1982628 RepID=UPI002E77C492|nr:N-acetylmuramoyl-L-alanine amidase [Faecalibacillus faecis]MEE0493149.1 N-acetylmuramoyl-L-alanine amidase [Faecalibacillus faecis]